MKKRLSDAVAEGMISSSPAASVARPERDRVERRFLSLDELEKPRRASGRSRGSPTSWSSARPCTSTSACSASTTGCSPAGVADRWTRPHGRVGPGGRASRSPVWPSPSRHHARSGAPSSPWRVGAMAEGRTPMDAHGARVGAFGLEHLGAHRREERDELLPVPPPLRACREPIPEEAEAGVRLAAPAPGVLAIDDPRLVRRQLHSRLPHPAGHPDIWVGTQQIVRRQAAWNRLRVSCSLAHGAIRLETRLPSRYASQWAIGWARPPGQSCSH